jgi:hypothetical protein
MRKIEKDGDGFYPVFRGTSEMAEMLEIAPPGLIPAGGQGGPERAQTPVFLAETTQVKSHVYV